MKRGGGNIHPPLLFPNQEVNCASQIHNVGVPFPGHGFITGPGGIPRADGVKPAPAQAPANPSAKVVARVNGSALTDADLLREEYAIFPYARQHSGIPKDLAPQIRDGAMKMIIFEELVYQEALR